MSRTIPSHQVSPQRARHRASIACRALLGGIAGLAVVLGTCVSGPAPSSAAVTRGAADRKSAESSQWLPPLRTPLVVTGPYAPPPHPYGSGHRGIDLLSSPGATVVSPADGVVSFAGNVAGRGVVSVRVDERTIVSIEPVATELDEGTAVQAGTVLGRVGDGGHCVGADGAVECVHLGVRVDDDYVNPLRSFFGLPRLLPW